MTGPVIHKATAVIDNGPFGKVNIRFETGRLAQQAGGAVQPRCAGRGLCGAVAARAVAVPAI